MKHVLIGVGIFVLGFILLSICSAIWCNGSASDINILILFAILYLSAVVGGSTSLVLEALRGKSDKLQ